MKDAFVLVVTSILFFACTGPTVAQEIELIPELKQWEPVLGKWNTEFEIKGNSTESWKKGTASYEIRSGGFFVKLAGVDESGGEKISWIEIFGYDPIQEGFVSSFFTSDGMRGGATSGGWNRTTLKTNFTNFTKEREVRVGRATWEYSAETQTITITVERFTDGEWWTSFKEKATKVE